jgi:hypothetical protein
VPPIVPEMGIDQTPMDFRDFHYLKEKLEPTFIKNHAVLVNKINVLEENSTQIQDYCFFPFKGPSNFP